MGTLALLTLLLQAAPDIAKLGMGAWDAYKKIVAAAKVKVGTPEERTALDRIEQRMHELDAEVRDAPEPA